MKRTVERKREGTLSTFHFPFSTSFGGSPRRSHGFTLIEMLVVIVIIVILMGVVFRLSRAAMGKGDTAREQRLVTLVRTLIEEFHAEYGIYPPVPEYRTHDGETRQPINFRGACPDATKSGNELTYYPPNWSYAKINNKDCFFIFGLMSFFVDRAKFVNNPNGDRDRAFDVGGTSVPMLVDQWGGFNDSVGRDGRVSTSQKDKAFAHRVWPIISELCSAGDDFDEPKIGQSYDIGTGYCKGFTTSVKGHWGEGIGFVDRGSGGLEPVYDEGLVYISKPPYTTYLLFSKGPDNKYDEDHPDDRTRPENKDNIYGNLGDK